MKNPRDGVICPGVDADRHEGKAMTDVVKDEIERLKKQTAELLRQNENLRATLRRLYLDHPEIERAARAAIAKVKGNDA